MYEGYFVSQCSSYLVVKAPSRKVTLLDRGAQTKASSIHPLTASQLRQSLQAQNALLKSRPVVFNSEPPNYTYPTFA